MLLKDTNNNGPGNRAKSQRYMKTKLTKKEIAALVRLSDKIWKLRNQYDEENGTDIELQIKSNGTVGGCLSVATAALDTILQEYN